MRSDTQDDGHYRASVWSVSGRCMLMMMLITTEATIDDWGVRSEVRGDLCRGVWHITGRSVTSWHCHVVVTGGRNPGEQRVRAPWGSRHQDQRIVQWTSPQVSRWVDEAHLKHPMWAGGNYIMFNIQILRRKSPGKWPLNEFWKILSFTNKMTTSKFIWLYFCLYG